MKLTAPDFDAGQGEDRITRVGPAGPVVDDQSLHRIRIEKAAPGEGISAQVIRFDAIVLGGHPFPQGDAEARLRPIDDFLGQDALH